MPSRLATLKQIPMSLPVLGALLCLGSLGPGCRNPEKPKFDVGERLLLLVPFRDLSVRYGHGYGESERGKKVVESIRNWTEKNFEPLFADSQSTETVVRELREWRKEKIASRDWNLLLKGVDADLVLLGEITSIRTKDPKSIGFHKGAIEGRYTVIRASTGREAYQSTPMKIEYPTPRDLDAPMVEFGTEPEQIEKALLKLLGEQVGKDLYGYWRGGD